VAVGPLLLSMLVVTRIDAMVDIDGLDINVVSGLRLSILQITDYRLPIGPIKVGRPRGANLNWHRHCEAHEGSIVVAWVGSD
jgi:hypothetical protein